MAVRQGCSVGQGPWDVEEKSHQREQRRRGSSGVDAVGVMVGREPRRRNWERGFLPGPGWYFPAVSGSSSWVRPLSIVTFASAVGLVASPSPSAVGAAVARFSFYLCI